MVKKINYAKKSKPKANPKTYNHINDWKRDLRDRWTFSYSLRGEIYDRGLALIDKNLKENNLGKSLEIFNDMKNVLVDERSGLFIDDISKYQKALVKSGEKIVRKSNKIGKGNHSYNEVMKYIEKHSPKPASSLEKTITAISLGSVVLGIAIGYPALTGNVIAETIPGSFKHGALLFLIGLTGIFLANKKPKF